VYVQLSSFYELYSCQERLSKFTTGEANAHFPSQASSALAPKIFAWTTGRNRGNAAGGGNAAGLGAGDGV
jgi:hypothetical protein